MANCNVERALGHVEGGAVIVPNISRFAEPQARHPPPHLAALDNVFKSSQLMKRLANGLVHFGGAAMVLGVSGLHGPQFEKIDDLGSMRQISIKLPPPTGRSIARPMRHHIELNLCLGFVLDAGAEQIERKKIHLL